MVPLPAGSCTRLVILLCKICAAIMLCENTDCGCRGYLIDSAYNTSSHPFSPPPSVPFVVFAADGLAHKASHCCHAAIATRIYSPPSVE